MRKILPASQDSFHSRFNRIRDVEPELGQLTRLTNLSIRENQVLNYFSRLMMMLSLSNKTDDDDDIVSHKTEDSVQVPFLWTLYYKLWTWIWDFDTWLYISWCPCPCLSFFKPMQAKSSASLKIKSSYVY